MREVSHLRITETLTDSLFSHETSTRSNTNVCQSLMGHFTGKGNSQHSDRAEGEGTNGPKKTQGRLHCHHEHDEWEDDGTVVTQSDDSQPSEEQTICTKGWEGADRHLRSRTHVPSSPRAQGQQSCVSHHRLAVRVGRRRGSAVLRLPARVGGTMDQRRGLALRTALLEASGRQLLLLLLLQLMDTARSCGAPLSGRE